MAMAMMMMVFIMMMVASDGDGSYSDDGGIDEGYCVYDYDDDDINAIN